MTEIELSKKYVIVCFLFVSPGYFSFIVVPKLID